jgi:hypothetical protein
MRLGHKSAISFWVWFLRSQAIAVLMAQRIDRDKAGIISNSPSALAPMAGSAISYAKEKWRELARFERIQSQQIIMAALFVLIVGGQAVYRALHPSRSDYDYLQLVANLNAHPIASVLGALLPAIIFSPLVHWMFGWILRRNAARFKTCEHCAETIKAAAKVCRYCGRDVTPVEQAEGRALQQGADVKPLEPTRAALAADGVSVTEETQSRNSRKLPMVTLVIACTFGLVVYVGLNFDTLKAKFAGPDFDSDKFLASYSTQQKMEWPGKEITDGLWVIYKEGIDAYNRGDYVTAMRRFSPLAKQGDAPARFYVGWMYANGRGVSKNDAEAAKWYRLAANQGIASAQYCLGRQRTGCAAGR